MDPNTRAKIGIITKKCDPAERFSKKKCDFQIFRPNISTQPKKAEKEKFSFAFNILILRASVLRLEKCKFSKIYNRDITFNLKGQTFDKSWL